MPDNGIEVYLFSCGFTHPYPSLTPSAMHLNVILDTSREGYVFRSLLYDPSVKNFFRVLELLGVSVHVKLTLK